MSLSRRDFLLSGGAVLGTAVLSKYADIPLIAELAEETTNKNTQAKPSTPLPPFLGEEVEFLRGTEGVECFAETIADIDESIQILPTRKKSRFDGSILEIKENLTYADIPPLLLSIAEKNSESVSTEKIRSFSEKYREKSIFLAQMAGGSEDIDKKDLLKQNSFHYFFVACLFEGKPITENILKEFENFILRQEEGTREVSEETKSDIVHLVSGLESELVTLKKAFSLSSERRLHFQKDFEKNPETTLIAYLKTVEDFVITSYPEQKMLFPLVRNILITSFKVSETFFGFQKQETKSQVFQDLYDKTVNFFAERAEKQKEDKAEKIKKVQGAIGNAIQKEIAQDFESSLYYVMMDDFVLKGDLKNAVVESFQNMKDTLVVNSYLNTVEGTIPKKNRTRFFELSGKLTNSETVDPKLLEDICKLVPEEISEDIRRFYAYLTSEGFLSLKNLLGKGDFVSLKKQLSSLEGNTKRFALFILTSVSGYYINNISKGSSILEGNYQADKFELSNLKRGNAKYNCMSISALNNYVLEELFGLTGLGMNFHKYQGIVQSHQTNAIDLGDGEILVSDVTNDVYFFLKNDGINLRYTYDIDRYANSYMSAAYFNIHGKYARKYFDNIFYQTYTEFTGKKYFDYIMKLQESGKNNAYALKQRRRMHEMLQ